MVWLRQLTCIPESTLDARMNEFVTCSQVVSAAFWIAVFAVATLESATLSYERRSRRPGLTRTDLTEPYRTGSGSPVCAAHPSA